MKKILLILSSVFVMTFTSCVGFLDKYPSNSIPADEAIQTPEDAQFYIMGLYSAFKNEELVGEAGAGTRQDSHRYEIRL